MADTRPEADVAGQSRVPPHNLEAERAVLGRILLADREFEHVAALIEPSDFFTRSHQQIFKAMRALRRADRPIDYITLKDELWQAGELDLAGGPSYLASLGEYASTVSNIEYYVRIVKDKATLRKLIASANRILRQTRKPSTR